MDKKEIIKKNIPNKNDKINNESESKPKTIENEQKETNNQPTANNTTDSNIIKDKFEPPNKNKVGPIARNKRLKGNQAQDEQIKTEKEEKNENKKKLVTNYKKNNINKKGDVEEEIDDYKNYLNKNDKNKKNEIDNYDPNIINTLLSQMNSLSEKQLTLIDVMDNIQMETQGEIKVLNKRISKLERNIEELNNELYYIKNDN